MPRERQRSVQRSSTESSTQRLTVNSSGDVTDCEPAKRGAVRSKRQRSNDRAATGQYSPLAFFRCHSHDNDPDDCDTKVWASAFEPPMGNGKGNCGILASCGGNSVCLFDVGACVLIQKFNQVDEDFFVLAWSSIGAPGGQTNILAAAGLLGRITLFHPERNVCFAHLQAHKTYICSLTFHPERAQVLFTGAKNGDIFQWDLDIDIGSSYRCGGKKLSHFRCPGKDVLNLAVVDGLLVAGAHRGCYAWKLDTSPQTESPTWHIALPGLEAEMVDGLRAVDPRTVVAASSQKAIMHVWSTAELHKAKRGVAKISSVCRLERTPAATMYLNVACCNDVVAAGDDNGSLWLYDLRRGRSRDGANCTMPVSPNVQLVWPECVVGSRNGELMPMDGLDVNPVINNVCFSPCGTYLVACTDNNLLCVWENENVP